MGNRRAPDSDGSPAQAGSASGFSPVVACTESLYRSGAPIAYDRVKLIFVRDGSAIVFSEFGERPITVGDVVVLAANTLCGAEPEEWLTATSLYLDLYPATDAPARRATCATPSSGKSRLSTARLGPLFRLHLTEERGWLQP